MRHRASPLCLDGNHLLQRCVQILGRIACPLPVVRLAIGGMTAGRSQQIGPLWSRAFPRQRLQAGRPRRFVTGQHLEVDRCAATVLWVAFSTAPATVKLLVRVGGAADFKGE